VDGNDLFAVYQMTLDAVNRARLGGGPTLIEAVTYRVGPHTTADDPGRYRDSEEAREWARRDPLERVRLYLSERDGWSDTWQAQIEEEAAAEIDRAIGLAEEMPALSVGEMFDAVFDEPSPNLRRQQLEAEAGTR